MLREAELFVFAEQVLVEVLGRIREPDKPIVLPPLVGLPGADEPVSMHEVVRLTACDDGRIPEIVTGAAVVDAGADLVHAADAACAAVREVRDGDAAVRAGYGDTTARDYLLRLTVVRALIAHYVAAYLGSTACPLPEELARPLWEMTAPDAAAWRALGIFRTPLPIPALVSWRDRFLRTAGHEPHPLGH